MRTAPRRDTASGAAVVGARPARPGARRWLAAFRPLVPVAGPLLIVATVLVAMRAFVFTDLLTNQHPDVLAQWLPRYCFLGRSLADGHVPLWNPHQMAGMPYASDPQSGWLYAPAMGLFTALPCSRALGAFIAFQPLLAGLGLYWFLRREGLNRTASTAGGLSIAMLISASVVGLALPFAAMLAWTPIVLVAASGYLSASRLAPRLGWLALGAFAWGQVASAHMSHGLFMSTLALVLYLAARAARSVRWGERTALSAALLVLAFLAFLPLANVAVFLPRLDLIPHTSLRGGYAALGRQLARVAGIDERPLAEGGVWSSWPLVLGSSPGAYAGAAILVAIPGAIRTLGKRYLALAFGLAGLVGYLLTLDLLIGAEWFRSLVLRLPYGDVYLHNPGRLRYLLLLVVPVLGAVGIHGLMERPPSPRKTRWWLGVGPALFLALPLALGGRPVRFLLLALGAGAAVPLLAALARRSDPAIPRGDGAPGRWARRAVWALPVALAVELTAGATFGHLYRGGPVTSGVEPPVQHALAWGPLRWPAVHASDYLRPTPFVEIVRGQNGRYLTWAPPAAFFQKGYLFTQAPEDWPALENSRGTLFGIPDALGYNPVQLSRYWSFVRATNQVTIFYNAAVLQEPALSDLRLLGVRYLIAPSYVEPRLVGERIATDGRFALWQVRGYERRVSVVPNWYHVPDPAVALLNVLQPAFDPRELAVVETDPGIERVIHAERGRATYEEQSAERIRIVVDAPAPSLVLIRNAWDRNWTATVDGRPAEVLRADYFLQAVPVSPGHHVVRLVYRDPRVFQGLLASGIVWSLLAAAVAAALVLERRRRSSPPSGDGEPEIAGVSRTVPTGA